jgi:hypothetical protein
MTPARSGVRHLPNFLIASGMVMNAQNARLLQFIVSPVHSGNC